MDAESDCASAEDVAVAKVKVAKVTTAAKARKKSAAAQVEVAAFTERVSKRDLHREVPAVIAAGEAIRMGEELEAPRTAAAANSAYVVDLEEKVSRLSVAVEEQAELKGTLQSMQN
ncbi:unnamed protein product, partial [Sphacelaria rigidula]